MSSMPAMVIEAHRKRFNPSIGPKRSLIDRWSCSIRLFKYFDLSWLARRPEDFLVDMAIDDRAGCEDASQVIGETTCILRSSGV